MSEEPPCPRRGKWIAGCRFEPRFDTGAPTTTRITNSSSDDAATIIESSKPRTYVRDVCVTCGRTIERTA